MWETIKNDPILKTVTIIILSVLGFGFAFNIMFGARSGGMDGSEMGGSGYSLGNTLSYIFILAFKLLLIALVIFAIIAIFKFAKKHLNLGGEEKMIDTIKKDPVLKGVSIAVLAIIAFGLVYYLFRGLFGVGSGYGMTNGNNIMGSAGYSLGIAGLLAVLLKLLLVASIAGLIIGLIMYIKQSYGTEITAKLSTITTVSKKSVNCSSCGTVVSSEFKFCPSCGGNIKSQCSSCGAELKNEWKCCPVCGIEVGSVKKDASETSKTENVIKNFNEANTETVIETFKESQEVTGGTNKKPKDKRS